MEQKIIFVLLLIILPACPTQSLDYTAGPHSSDPHEGGWIELQGENMISVPSASCLNGSWTPKGDGTLNEAGASIDNGTLNANETANGSWTYPFPEYPSYEENETISGIFWGDRTLADANATLCLSAFSLADFLSALGITNKSINLTPPGPKLQLNETGDAAFSLPGRPMGIYTLYLADNQNHTILSAAPVLVTRNLQPDLPSNLSAGQILPVRLNSSAPAGNYTLAALMLPEESYSSASLALFRNMSVNVTARLTISNQSLDLLSRPKDYEQLLSQILALLPEDSSAAMQESRRANGQLYLLTDQDWHRGKYMLICAIYTSGQGVVALGQSVLEVV